jgi:hypothetical protein
MRIRVVSVSSCTKPSCKLQEDERKKEEKDERKRKYNVTWNDQVTSSLSGDRT